MRCKQKWLLRATTFLVGFFILLSGMPLLYSQETTTQTTQEKEEQKKKVETDKKDKVTQTGKEQTPEQTATKRKEAAAREKALAEAKEKAKLEAAGKAQNEDGEYVYTNVLATEKATAEKVTTPQQTKEYWQNLKMTLDKQLLAAKDTLQQLQERLLKTRMDYLRESSPLRQNELQQEINNLIASIASQENVLLNSQQLLNDLADKARKAGVPPGWVR